MSQFNTSYSSPWGLLQTPGHSRVSTPEPADDDKKSNQEDGLRQVPDDDRRLCAELGMAHAVMQGELRNRRPAWDDTKGIDAKHAPTENKSDAHAGELPVPLPVGDEEAALAPPRHLAQRTWTRFARDSLQFACHLTHETTGINLPAIEQTASDIAVMAAEHSAISGRALGSAILGFAVAGLPGAAIAMTIGAGMGAVIESFEGAARDRSLGSFMGTFVPVTVAILSVTSTVEGSPDNGFEGLGPSALLVSWGLDAAITGLVMTSEAMATEDEY